MNKLEKKLAKKHIAILLRIYKRNNYNCSNPSKKYKTIANNILQDLSFLNCDQPNIIFQNNTNKRYTTYFAFSKKMYKTVLLNAFNLVNIKLNNLKNKKPKHINTLNTNTTNFTKVNNIAWSKIANLKHPNKQKHNYNLFVCQSIRKVMDVFHFVKLFGYNEFNKFETNVYYNIINKINIWQSPTIFFPLIFDSIIKNLELFLSKLINTNKTDLTYFKENFNKKYFEKSSNNIKECKHILLKLIESRIQYSITQHNINKPNKLR